MEWNVTDKILFGTDFPVTTVQETPDHMRRANAVVALLGHSSLGLGTPTFRLLQATVPRGIVNPPCPRALCLTLPRQTDPP